MYRFMMQKGRAEWFTDDDDDDANYRVFFPFSFVHRNKRGERGGDRVDRDGEKLNKIAPEFKEQQTN